MSEKKRQPKQTQWSRAWNERNLDRLFITVPKGLKKRIQAHATQHGETVNGMVGRLLQRELGLSDEQWKTEER